MRKNLLLYFLLIISLECAIGRPVIVWKDKDRAGNKYDYVHLSQTPNELTIKCMNPGNIVCYDEALGMVQMDDGDFVDISDVEKFVLVRIKEGDSSGVVNYAGYWVKWTSSSNDYQFQIHDTFEEMSNHPWIN